MGAWTRENLATEAVAVNADASVDMATLVGVRRKAGYDVAASEVVLQIDGMTRRGWRRPC